MKQRITYILPEGTDLSRSDVLITEDSLRFAKADKATQEWRLTLGLEELPDELSELLKDTHELHIRWVSSRNQGQLPPPLVSRLSAGFHAFFTPRAGTENVPLCRLFDIILGTTNGKCHSVSESFSVPQILSGRFASAATYQYFQYAPLSEQVASLFLQKEWQDPDGQGSGPDSGAEWRRGLESASYVDIDFDAIGHALTFTAVWAAGSNVVRGEVRKGREGGRVEVGMLQAEAGDEPEELSLGGFLTVIGEDDRPSPSAFSFPSRHHPLPAGSRARYEAAFQHPTGLHPKLDIALSRRQLRPPKDSCALHAYWTLPSALFIDRYQFSDPLFLASQNLAALRSLSGEEDLEAPDWILKRWGSAALLELAYPNTTGESGESDWMVTIPTHLRYLAGPQLPTDPPDQATLEIPWPTVFWACEAEEGLKMSNNPFDRVNLGFDGLFGPKTMFYHVPPSKEADSLVAEVKVPVLDSESAGYVRSGTAMAVLLGFAWVCFKMMGRGRGSEGSEGKKSS